MGSRTGARPAPKAGRLLALRSLCFALLLPGTVTLLLPYFILSGRGGIAIHCWSAVQYLALMLIAAGGVILIRCIRDFARIGRGTLAPVDSPKRLVVRGLYRYVRNPMYVGVLLIVLGEAILFESFRLAIYAVLLWLGFHLFVVLYEEPTLRRKFGAEYEAYIRSVGRWIPRIRQ